MTGMPMLRLSRAVLCVLAPLTLAAGGARAAADDDAFYRERIGPLLEKHCYPCHSHASGKMKNGLTLDSRSGWATGGERGPAVTPGDVEKSLLIRAVRHTDPDLRMPKEKLPAADIAALEEWVRRGAPDPRTPPVKAEPEDWWSLRPLVKPTPPAGPVHPVDAFVQAKLAEKNLSPAKEADRRTLIRRVMIDLHGLPPTPEEMDAFVADRDARAYEKLVDRLLASPRHGERWARHWLDTIHFADSHGFEHDVMRTNAWRYRDYVIASLNADTSWPRFIREQLAADVFFPDVPRLTAALGFLGAGPYDQSAAGTAPQTFEYLDRDDLVTQVMGAFASTTANCARCHAHKFDPITQGDYFALQAVFAGIGKGDVSYDEDAVVARERRRWETLKTAAEKTNRTVLLAAENAALVAEWEKARGGSAAAWTPLEPEVFVSADGATLERLPDGSIRSAGTRPDKDTVTLTSAMAKRATITALRLDVLTDSSLPLRGPGRMDNGNLHLTEFEARAFPPGATQAVKVKFRRASADFDQTGWDISKALDGDLKTAWGIHPKVGEPHHAVFELGVPLKLERGARLAVVLKQLHGGGHIIGRFRLSATDAPAAVTPALPANVEAALAVASAKRTVEQKLALAGFVLRRRASDELAKMPPPVKVFAAGARAENERGVITYAEPRVIRVLRRGDLDKPGDEAGPGALTAIASLKARFDCQPKDEAARRAALAEWLADANNPLTWRSVVNRVWHYHFGRGLCDTPSDFGRMGGVPSHPELIEWLAVWFRDDAKGSLKALHRLIVTSAAYRRESVIGESVISKPVDGNTRAASAQTDSLNTDSLITDPDNRLLWRMNRARLDADSYRDAVLAVSGRLDLTAGGPGAMHFKSSPGPQATPVLDYTAFNWDKPGAARRSIYRVVWRGIPDPFMDALDFPDTALLTPVRGFSASPLQALALMNNEFVLQHAAHLARRAEKSAGTPAGQIRAAVRLTLLREPTPAEAADFAALAAQHGLPAVCRLLLNSNEFLFVD